jgi:hypothetical protein
VTALASKAAPGSDPLRNVLELHSTMVVEGSPSVACSVLDISPGGGRLRSRYSPIEGSEVRLMITGLGAITGLAGAVSAHAPDGTCTFGIEFLTCDTKKRRLGSALARKFNAKRLAATPKIAQSGVPGHVRVERDEGPEFEASIVDISLLGVLFRSEARPSPGSQVRVGGLTGRIHRLLDDGFDVIFDPPAQLDVEA